MESIVDLLNRLGAPTALALCLSPMVLILLVQAITGRGFPGE